jgi:hypothetical protein
MLTPRIAVLAVLAIANPARAQEAGAPQENTTELAKESQNPVSDLISVPFQFNFNNGGALGEQSMFNVNLQPVIPIHLTQQWNLIARTIIPFLSMPTVNGARDTGLGDIQEQLFFSPAANSGFIWGLGPLFSFPTATLASAATGSWAAGPAGVGLWIGGAWVVGALATADWTYAHSGSTLDIGGALVQPFINYNLGNGWALTSSPMITAAWGGDGATQWTVPVGGGVSWTTEINTQAMSFGVQYYYNVVRPEDGTPNLLRFVVSLLFPDKPKPKSAATAQR